MFSSELRLWALTCHRQLHSIAALHGSGPSPVLCLAEVRPAVRGPQAVPRQLSLAGQEHDFPRRGAPEPAVADGRGPAGFAGQAGAGSGRDRQPQLPGSDDGLGGCHWNTKRRGPGHRALAVVGMVPLP